MSEKPWTVGFSHAAKADLDGVLRQTLADFGTHQLRLYANLIEDAVKELETGGDQSVLLKYRPEIGEDVYSYPIRRAGHNSRHHFYLLFRRDGQMKNVWIVRMLHERMDALRHVLSDK